MKPASTLAAIACLALAGPVAAEPVRVFVRNDSGVPKVVPVYLEAGGSSSREQTDRQGKININIDCNKKFKVYIRIEDVMARSVVPKSYAVCPSKKDMYFVVDQN